MKNPADLSRDELIAIVTGLFQILYGREHEDGTWTYAADKEWSGGDVCEAAAALLDQYGLLPAAEGAGEPMEPAAVPKETRQHRDLCRQDPPDESALKNRWEVGHGDP
jgi:hypothetical protein